MLMACLNSAVFK